MIESPIALVMNRQRQRRGSFQSYCGSRRFRLDLRR
jgi:hypothetical protein